jgi:hypothetical protein
VENISIGASHSGLTIEGAGADQTILDGDQAGPVLALVDWASGTIRALAITNGQRGIVCTHSNPVFTDCAISGNTTSDEGGGARCEDSDPVFLRCRIIDNNSGTSGGGVYAGWDSHPEFRACTIDGNSALYGGGLYVNNGSSLLLTSRISGNEASHQGAGVYVSGGQHAINNCTVCGNSGIGVVVAHDARAVLANSLVAENTDSGVLCQNSLDPLVTNCTIVGNHDHGLYCSSNTAVSNCIFWGNSPDSIFHWSGALTVTYSDVEGDWSGTGNIDEDPVFVDADGLDDDPATWDDNDYRLLAGSPCIDAGDNTAGPADVCDLDEDGDVEEPLPFDLDDNPRFHDDVGTADTGNPDGVHPIVDIGAYEFQGTTVFPGDLDGDGDVDIDDLELFVGCMAGADNPAPPGCDPLVFENADLDSDGDIDLADFAVFQQVFTGQ